MAEPSGEKKENGDSAHTGWKWGDKVHISNHPVLAHKITIMRSSTTPNGTFRALLREVTYLLGYEATSRLTMREIAITVPVAAASTRRGDDDVQHIECTGNKIKESVALVPIMRSGLGMIDAMLELIPKSAIHHIGMYKRAGENPVQYFNRLPRECSSDIAYVLDPLIASGGSVVSVISTLKKWGVAEINVLAVVASKKGIEQLVEAHPDVYITIGAVDDQLSETGNVLPGLGDVGDRQFGTDSFNVGDDEALLHPSKRKRSMDMD